MIDNHAIVKALNDLGFEAKILIDYQKINQQLKVAQITKIIPHSTLHNLSICTISDGKNHFSIVCGAKNYEVGNKVVFAPVGTDLGGGLLIKKRRFINIVSEGMMCSWAELGLPSDNNRDIAILPANSILGAQPLQFVGADDCLFNVAVPWNQKEIKTILVLSQYLAQYLQIPFHNSLKSDLSSVSSSISKRALKPFHLQFLGMILLPNFVLLNSPTWLIWALKMHEKKATGNFLIDLGSYVAIMFQVSLQIVPIANKPTIMTNNDDEFIHHLQNHANSKTEWEKAQSVIIISDTSKSQELPPIFTYWAYQQYLFMLKQVATGLEIVSVGQKPDAWSCQSWTFHYDFIDNLLGTKIDFDQFRRVLSQLGFVVFKNQKDHIEIQTPPYRHYLNKNQIVSEFLRFYGINQIIPQKISSPIFQVNDDQLTLLDQVSNYLLHLGLKRVKTFTFSTKDALCSLPHHITLKTNKHTNQMQCNLVGNLTTVIQEHNRSVFSIDKTFHFNDAQQINESLNLGALWLPKWVQEPLTSNQINVNYHFLIEIIKNIIHLFQIDHHKIYKQCLVLKPQQKNIVNTNNLDPIWTASAQEKLFYCDVPIGFLQQVALKNNQPKKYFYFELNLTQLFILYQTHKQPKQFQAQSKMHLLHQDFCLEFAPPFAEKVFLKYAQGKELQFVEHNYYDYLIKKIHSYDRKIWKVDIIDVYHDKKLNDSKIRITLRVWKKTSFFTTKAEPTRSLFAKIEKELTNWKNAKIV